MTTIVVHGTMAYGGSWYQDSWEGNGFLATLSDWMLQVSDWHDVWLVGNNYVWDYPELGSVYAWTGLAEGIYRGIAAQQLARYLNIVADLTDEPIRIIAHSHGCNVVKLASSLPELAPNVYIDQAVFLACPHFYEDEYTQAELGWQDRVNIRKVNEAYQKTGYRFRYRVNPRRFRRILNIYCEKDKVQVDLARSLSGGTVPLTGNFLQNVLQQLSTGMQELPQATRQDLDEDAAHLYEDLEVAVESSCSGIKTHSVMHGGNIGALAGAWLNTNLHIQQVLDEVMEFPVLPCNDTGE
jgi:hypothetical protein